MHYHNVFLVKAKNKADALEKVKDFLEPYCENDGENPEGEWDWKQFGGRWMWSDLIGKYTGVIYPNGKYYINKYHDKPYIGKTVVLQFPDGTIKETSYGSDVEYAIQRYVHNNPLDSEVKPMTDEDVYLIIEKQINYRDKWSNLTKWVAENHFWNITDNSPDFDKKEVIKNAKDWFIVNVDLHS